MLTERMNPRHLGINLQLDFWTNCWRTAMARVGIMMMMMVDEHDDEEDEHDDEEDEEEGDSLWNGSH